MKNDGKQIPRRFRVGWRERRWIMRTGRVLSTAICRIIRMDNN